ncbi:MAG TPA: GNAT family N-acetyltransferase [Acidobacteriaceae bacterium]|nr:GNAT family N-acetyltransferase [Acidobacteriaceae bacterium]
MTPALHLEILDLRHFTASNLKPVLEAESLAWNQRLHWDFHPSANLLLQYLDSRLLPGYVAIENGRICGYVFCVYEGEKALVGDVFAVPSAGNPELAADVERRLLEHMIELLQNSPGVERIESQLLLRPHGTHAETLRNSGFQIYERLFMELELGSAKSLERSRNGGFEGLELRSWRDSDFSAAGQLIAHAYEGHLDGIINDQYRSVAGSLRFLHNIVRFPGCGQFDPTASRVLVYRGKEEMLALLLCSRVREDVGHVTQICVNRRYRRRGLGAWLLSECSRALRSHGFQALTLTVTRQNSEAVALYHRSGFVTRQTFDAMVWERRDRSRI